MQGITAAPKDITDFKNIQHSHTHNISVFRTRTSPGPATRLHLLLSALFSLSSLLLWIWDKLIPWCPCFVLWLSLHLSLTLSSTGVFFLFATQYTWHNKWSPVK
jgi:hypothetical protein